MRFESQPRDTGMFFCHHNAKLLCQVGESTVKRERNPLDMIKGAAPLLSQEKKQAPARALSALETEAGRDETCVWQRVSSSSLTASCMTSGTEPCYGATTRLIKL